MSAALDLVEEFRSLGEIEEDANGVVGPKSIGGADLSGILALDDDDDGAGGGDFEDSAENLSCSTPLRASASASASFLDGGMESSFPGQKLARGGRQLDLDRESSESRSRDSDNYSNSNGQGGRKLNNNRTAGVDDAGAGGGEQKQQLDTPPAASLAAGYGRAGSSSSSSSSAGSNRNVSSPTRPAEEGSDWDEDGYARQSSDDTDTESEGRQTRSSSHNSHWSVDAAAAAAAVAAQGGESYCTTRGGNSAADPSAPSSPVSKLGAGRSGALSTTGEDDKTTLILGGGGGGGGTLPVERDHQRSPSPSREDGTARQAARRDDNDDDDDDEQEDNSLGNHTVRHSRTAPGMPTEAFLADARPAKLEGEEAARTGVEALRAELSTLREHVICSERKREAQLRDLVARLDAQEERRGGGGGDSSPARGAGSAVRAAAPAGGADEAGKGRAGTSRLRRDKGAATGTGTPRRGAVRNPFAGTGGGAAVTPRDHFPAFEDALLDDGDGDEEGERGPHGSGRGGRRGRRREEEEEEEEEENKSALLHHSEAFDFSIDTLSHINNHTDFGTNAPVVAAAASTATAASTAPPAAIAATSPKIGSRDGRGAGRGGQKGTARLSWLVEAPPPAPNTGVRLQDEEEEEEVFDAKDAAAEEAFFSDACATASLKTPVKHLLATAAVDLGVAAVRRGRQTTCAATTAASTPTPVRRRPPPSSWSSSPNGEREQRERLHEAEAAAASAAALGRPPHGRESVQSCGDRVLSANSPQSPQLCMADFFARASAELLDGGVKHGGQEGARRGPSTGTAAGEGGRARAVATAAGSPRPAGVDAACQTTLSFSSHDEIRFVSAPPSVRVPDGRGRRVEEKEEEEEEADGGVEWSGLGRGNERSLEKHSSSGIALGPAACAHSDGRGGGGGGGGGSCRTPRQSRASLCQTPSRTPRSKRCGLPADGARVATEAPSFFNSPNLSPIAAAAAAGDVASCSGAPKGGAPGSFGEGDLEDGGSGGGGEGGATLDDGVGARRKRRGPGFGYGLSPILSEGRGSASSKGGEGRQVFDSHAMRGDDSVRASRASGLKMGAGGDYDGDGDGDGGDDHGARRTDAPAREEPPFFLGGGGGAAIPKPAAAARSSGSGPLFMDCSPLFMDSTVDVARSSVLRASTTLNTIAPLDNTGLSSYSSSGVSFAGELFADARLRVSSGAERAPRYDVFVPLGEQELLRGDGDRGGGGGGGAAAVPPSLLRWRRQEFSQQQQQRRSRSAPTLASEWSMHSSRSEVERLAAGMAGETASFGPGGVPPAVVGAWLAAAVEGIYSHNVSVGSRGGGGLTDQRVGAKRGPIGGRGSPVTSVPAAAAGGSLPNAGQAVPARYAAGPGDSPPPPPPPPLETLTGGEDEEAVDEEEIFYERQRLLQRAVSAAASHGGVMPSLSSVRDTSMEEGQGQEEQDAGGSSSNSASKIGRSWRRCSDPLSSWKTPSVAAVAEAAAAAAAAAAHETETAEPPAGAAAAAAGWTVGVAPAAAAYTRRHTSGYWRDRLGMTH